MIFILKNHQNRKILLEHLHYTDQQSLGCLGVHCLVLCSLRSLSPLVSCAHFATPPTHFVRQLSMRFVYSFLMKNRSRKQMNFKVNQILLRSIKRLSSSFFDLPFSNNSSRTGKDTFYRSFLRVLFNEWRCLKVEDRIEAEKNPPSILYHNQCLPLMHS